MGKRSPRELGFEAHGVRFSVGASDDKLLGLLTGWLPPGTQTHPREAAERRFAILADDRLGYRMQVGDDTDSSFDLDLAIGTVQRRIGTFVAARATDRVFIHSGVVADRGRAIMIPGHSMRGKTTLVTELLRLGAEFYSDEYAVLDEHGLAHPYAEPLSVRDADGQPQIRWPEDFGAENERPPVPVGVIAMTSYREGAEWNPQRRTAGAGVISLLAHSRSIAERPADTLAAARSGVEGAVVLEGERGEAADAASRLLEILA